MKKALVLTFLIIIVATSASALTWSEAVSLAEQNNNELKSAEKQLEASEWTYRKAFSAFLPQVSGTASMTDTRSATSAAWTKSYSYGLSGTQYLFQGMAGIYGIQSAYADVEYKKASLQSTRASVFYDLRSAFVEVLVAQENEQLLQKILKQRHENTQLIQLRYDSGKEDKGNLMQTKADQAKAEYELTSAGRDLRLAKLKLSQLLQKAVTVIDDKFELQAPQRVNLNRLLTETPTYLVAKKTFESAEIVQKNTISEFLPSVSLSGSYRKTGSNWPPDTSNKSWSLNVSLPIFPGGSNLADRVIYAAKLDQAREDLISSINDLRYSLEEAYENYKDTLEALEVAKLSLAAAKERAMISRAKYLNGLTNYDDWDRIENTYIQSQKSLLTYEKSAFLAEALWHKTYGGYVE